MAEMGSNFLVFLVLSWDVSGNWELGSASGNPRGTLEAKGRFNRDEG
jgi:hypothetical protein